MPVAPTRQGTRPRGRAEVVEAVLDHGPHPHRRAGPGGHATRHRRARGRELRADLPYVGTKDQLVREVYAHAARSAAERLTEAAHLDEALALLMTFGDGTARLVGWAALERTRPGESGTATLRARRACPLRTDAAEVGASCRRRTTRLVAALAMVVASVGVYSVRPRSPRPGSTTRRPIATTTGPNRTSPTSPPVRRAERLAPDVPSAGHDTPVTRKRSIVRVDLVGDPELVEVTRADGLAGAEARVERTERGRVVDGVLGPDVQHGRARPGHSLAIPRGRCSRPRNWRHGRAPRPCPPGSGPQGPVGMEAGGRALDGAGRRRRVRERGGRPRRPSRPTAKPTIGAASSRMTTARGRSGYHAVTSGPASPHAVADEVERDAELLAEPVVGKAQETVYSCSAASLPPCPRRSTATVVQPSEVARLAARSGCGCTSSRGAAGARVLVGEGRAVVIEVLHEAGFLPALRTCVDECAMYTSFDTCSAASAGPAPKSVSRFFAEGGDALVDVGAEVEQPAEHHAVLAFLDARSRW